MTQLGIDFEQREQLARVSSRIAKSVLEFCRDVGCQGGEFRIEQLHRFVRDCMKPEPISPDSPSRILRSLRQQGKVRYTVLSRSQSLYRVDWVQP